MAREMLAMLGAPPPLGAMLDQGGGGEERLAAALYALLNMGIGNDTNKAAIVQAGAVHKMLRIAEGASGALTGALVANFLCLSALDANKPIIGASGAAPFLVRAFEAAATEQERGGGGGRCQEEEEAEAEGEACCMSNEKRAVRQLVQQSLQSNMRRIVRRARVPQDLAPPDGLKALTSSSTSKSLPF
uniref:Uncharacterized protein n=1 Tax=Aegilops tauschii TaxID=37682 RepID=N1QXJ6_AEGTA